ncbi:MAG TPA: 1,4-alpha-glucan branching protein domain-containing protein, partial [bacterium]|nr:1,4-alpha-glucan branching protein domain-containing protein [bacterium]
VLAEQLAAPAFKREIEEFLRTRIASSRENAPEFERQGRTDLLAGAKNWEHYYRKRLEQFERLNGDLVAAFRRLHDDGHIHLITSAATHGYLPLLLRDESIDLQLRVAVASHRRHFGHAPDGVWLPECAYRPRYEWTPPAGPHRGRMRARRRGIEEFLGELGLGFFITDVHLARGGVPLSAYRDYYPALRTLSEREQQSFEGARSPYRPYTVASRGGRGEAAAFVRDPESTMQVWSREAGYPGDEWYLEFHKKHFPGGLRYWRVTSARSDLGAKQPYAPERAAERIASQADHFAGLLRTVLAGYRDRTNTPGIACSPYDTELFGHWWFEGPRWIQEIFQRLPGNGIAAVDCATYLERNPPSEAISLQEGSWGEGGDHRVWLNRDTEWTWERLYAVEEEFWTVARETVRSSSAMVRRVLAQTARELLLMQASDWQFLITTWAARDYAEARFAEHYANVTRLLQLLRRAAAGTAPEGPDDEFLHSREAQNFLFPDIATHLDAAVAAPA